LVIKANSLLDHDGTLMNSEVMMLNEYEKATNTTWQQIGEGLR